VVRAISKRAITEFTRRHPIAKPSLDQWYEVVRRAVWRSLADVKQVYPHADLAGRRTVFNMSDRHAGSMDILQAAKALIRGLAAQAVLAEAQVLLFPCGMHGVIAVIVGGVLIYKFDGKNGVEIGCTRIVLSHMFLMPGICAAIVLMPAIDLARSASLTPGRNLSDTK